MKYLLVLTLIFFNLTIIVAYDKNTVSADEDIDFSLANLVLTAEDEKSFQYTFDLTNGGTSEIQGYSMKLTFSADDILDESDNFFIIDSLSYEAAQWIGPNQTLLKTEHYYATSPTGFLPVGSWYVFAQINHDWFVPETDYTNNSILSTNMIVVNGYTIGFTTPPTITSITDSSFLMDAFFELDMTRIYYRVQTDGAPAPTASVMQNSDGMFPWENQTTVSGLGPAFDYDVYFMGEFYDQKVTVIYKIDVLTLGTSTPTLVLSLSEIVLETTDKDKASSPRLYSITGFHLTSDVIVTATGNFVVSKDNITYVDQISFLPASFAQGNSQWVFVRFLPDGVVGLKSGNVTNASTGGVDKTVSVTLTVFDPIRSDFNGLTSLAETGWTSYSVRGADTWSFVDLETSSPHQRESGDDKAIQIDGSINGFKENEDWLISPEIDLSGYIYDPTIKFRSYSSGDGPSLILKYSADFSGFGDPTVATWFDAVAEFPAANSNEWKKSFTAMSNKESKIHFAFVYNSTTDAASRWTIDDWAISDNLLIIPSNILSYQDVEVGTSSTAQSYDIKIIGFGDVTVSVSEGFQISLDDASFGSDVVIPENEAADGKTIYVRFTPLTQIQGLQGTLTFTAGELAVTKNTLVGSSLMTTATARRIESASFIYPNPTDGVVHVDVSSLYKQQHDMPVLVANNMGATVAEFQSSVGSLEIKLSEIISNLRPGLYYITIQADESIHRNKIMKE